MTNEKRVERRLQSQWPKIWCNGTSVQYNAERNPTEFWFPERPGASSLEIEVNLHYSPPTRGDTEQHAPTRNPAKGSRRHAHKVPMLENRRWIFRGFSSRMGMLNSPRGQLA